MDLPDLSLMISDGMLKEDFIIYLFKTLWVFAFVLFWIPFLLIAMVKVDYESNFSFVYVNQLFLIFLYIPFILLIYIFVNPQQR